MGERQRGRQGEQAEQLATVVPSPAPDARRTTHGRRRAFTSPRGAARTRSTRRSRRCGSGRGRDGSGAALASGRVVAPRRSGPRRPASPRQALAGRISPSKAIARRRGRRARASRRPDSAGDRTGCRGASLRAKSDRKKLDTPLPKRLLAGAPSRTRSLTPEDERARVVAPVEHGFRRAPRVLTVRVDGDGHAKPRAAASRRPAGSQRPCLGCARDGRRSRRATAPRRRWRLPIRRPRR